MLRALFFSPGAVQLRKLIAGAKSPIRARALCRDSSFS